MGGWIKKKGKKKIITVKLNVYCFLLFSPWFCRLFFKSELPITDQLLMRSTSIFDFKLENMTSPGNFSHTVCYYISRFSPIILKCHEWHEICVAVAVSLWSLVVIICFAFAFTKYRLLHFKMSNQLTAIIHKFSSLTSNPSYLLTEILDQKTILDHKIILKAETNVSCTMGSLRLTAKDEEIGWKV